jgi:hypothetical protein
VARASATTYGGPRAKDRTRFEYNQGQAEDISPDPVAALEREATIGIPTNGMCPNHWIHQRYVIAGGRCTRIDRRPIGQDAQEAREQAVDDTGQQARAHEAGEPIAIRGEVEPQRPPFDFRYSSR